MRVSLQWLREFVDLPTDDPQELDEVLSNLGLEVEEVLTVECGFSGVVVAKVLGLEPHPDADKVRIATLDAGGAPIEVVCGAWNFDVGATVAYARVGAVLPGGFEIGEKEVRGIVSPGMICSEIELGLGEEADGILVLEDGHAEPGADFAATLPYPDAIFDLSITPNRPDAMSIHGVARDLAAYYDLPVTGPRPELDEKGTTNAVVRIEEPERCLRFTAREVTNVSVGPSPLWMKLRLRDAGQRPISNVVDITNYVMLELGQPLHAFDLDKITDETIVVRLAEEGEPLTTLDGVQRTLSAEDLVIAGVQDPLGLAGVMGGGDSEVSDETGRVLIEVAHFEPTRVLLSGKRHALRTEAVARFERGVDPSLPPVASARAAELLAELAAGSVVGGFIDEHPRPIEPPVVELPASESARLLGIEIPSDVQADYLRRLGFRAEGDDPIVVEVPAHRLYDVSRPADLVEEIARIHGYDTIPSRVSIGSGGGLNPEAKGVRRLREAMVGAGFYEVMNFDWLGAADLGTLGLDPADPRSNPIRIRNPLNEEQEYLRTTLLPGLLRNLRHTAGRNRADAALFEIGAVFLRAPDRPLPEQPRRLAFVATGERSPRALESLGPFDVVDAVGLAEMLLAEAGIDGSVVQKPISGLHPGRGGTVEVEGREVGVVGELDPAVAAAWDLEGRVAVGDFDVRALLRTDPGAFVAPSPYPPIVFDLAFDVPEETPVAALRDEVRSASGHALERLEVFDVFRGPPLDEDRKSIALRLTLRSSDRTLTDAEVVPVRERIEERVVGNLGGVLRGG